MTITKDTPVGEIAIVHPMATKVFHRHQIDFCCGGKLPLAEACEKKGLCAQAIVDEINEELNITKCNVRWDHEPLSALIDHILDVYHRPLYEELPRLEAMARKVNTVHGDKHPDTLPKILNIYLVLKAELDQHFAKEEQVLFPMIKQGMGAMADGPVAVMEQEHDEAGAALRELRTLTNNYTVPAEACNTWRALWHGLQALEESLHEHIHLENNILFPRALNS